MFKTRYQISINYLSLFILVILFTGNLQAKSIPADKIQVSIRSALDKMYDLEQDSFSTIPPVIQTENDFTVTLQKPINYDTFPHFLHSELSNRNIDLEYNVQISRCVGDSIILTYDRLSFVNANTPCKSRHTDYDCQILKITFHEEERSSVAVPLILSFTILSLGLLGFIFIKKKEPSEGSAENDTSERNQPKAYTLGNTIFIPDNQLLRFTNEEKTLTHRECKLLEYFAKNPNLILKRDDITDAVWKEDGIITGRSLDVFVSRLRKLLSLDDRLQIKNIHGVGYKLEISSN